MHLPRLVRGKPGAWDPNLCLQWGSQFLSFLQAAIRNWDVNKSGAPDGSTELEVTNSSRESSPDQRHKSRIKEESVWRVTFHPGKGAEVVLLNDDEVADVRNGEDRVGFLPRFYWDEVVPPAKSELKNEGAKVPMERNE